MNKSAKVFMAETVALTPDRMFVEIRYKSLYMETYMVKQIISPPIMRFTLAEIFICKQRNNKILTRSGAAMTLFFANRPLTGVTITFIRCLYRVTGVSTGQGEVTGKQEAVFCSAPYGNGVWVGDEAETKAQNSAKWRSQVLT